MKNIDEVQNYIDIMEFRVPPSAYHRFHSTSLRNQEIVKHFLLECKLYKQQRVKMVKSVTEMWLNKKTIGTFNLCKEMLAGHTFSNKINKEDDKKVKQALFVFLKETKAIGLTFDIFRSFFMQD